jgi:hypothetical protein
MNTDSPFDASDIQSEIPELTTIASRPWWTTWRNYHYTDDDDHLSDWFELTEGGIYHIQATGAPTMSVAVEINQFKDQFDTIVTGETCECTPAVPEDCSACVDSSCNECITPNNGECACVPEDCSDCVDSTCAECVNPDDYGECACVPEDCSACVDSTCAECITPNNGNCACVPADCSACGDTECSTCVTPNTGADCACVAEVPEECVCTETTEDIPIVGHHDHHHSTKSLQQIAYEHTNIAEEWTIQIDSPDDGAYVLNLVNNVDGEISLHTTRLISSDANPGTVQTALNRDYYRGQYGCDVSVSRVIYDANGAEITDMSLAASLVYTVSVNKRIAGFSATMISAAPTSDRNNEKTAARITVTPPTAGIQSSLPFSGDFAITCTDFNGNSYTSRDIAFNEDYRTMVLNMQYSMPFLVDNFEVVVDNRFSYR